MPLNETRIDAVEASVSILILNGEPLIPELRRHFPDIAFVRCDAEDMDAAPYRSGEHYQLFLLNRSEACLALTDRPELADCIVVAKK